MWGRSCVSSVNGVVGPERSLMLLTKMCGRGSNYSGLDFHASGSSKGLLASRASKGLLMGSGSVDGRLGQPILNVTLVS